MNRLLRFCVMVLILAGASSLMAQDQFKGFYLGGMIGPEWSKGDYHTFTMFSPTGYFATSSIPAIASSGTMKLDSMGFNLTADAGYNWIHGHMLLGVETEFGALYNRDFNDGGAFYPCCFPTQFAIRSSSDTNWMFTARPRLGYTSGKWLVYGTAGLAVTNRHNKTLFTDTFATARESGKLDENKLGWIAGGGLEYKIFQHWSMKGEYLYSEVGPSNYTSTNLTAFSPPIAFPTNAFTHGIDNHAHILRFGVSYYFRNGTPPTPPSASCSASPSDVMTGDGVTVNATANNFKAGHTLDYDWHSTGGKISGNGASAHVDTTGMSAGSYTATAHITDKKDSKAMADCSASFTVREPNKNPPQISCSANPSTVMSGQASTISCSCTSPDGAQLQPLAWSTSAGHIAGEGMNASLDTSGVGAGSVSVSTTCTDVRGLSSSTTTNVNVEVPSKLEASKINECAFPNKVKPGRVDNTCKAALDDVALRLQREPDAKAVIVGQSDPKEKPANVAAQRATNTKEYLVKEKQIDASRLETRTGMDGGRRVEIYIVPAGATFNEANTTMVMAPAAKPMHKKAAKKATK